MIRPSSDESLLFMQQQDEKRKMHSLTQQLQTILWEDIPISQAMGIRVVEYTAGRLTMTAPLHTNRNHKQTAFAGSLYSLVTLTGWGMCWLILQEQELSARIVIQEGGITYQRPVSQDFLATCQRPTVEPIARMATTLRKRGKARLDLDVTIEQQDLAVCFRGRYVMQQDSTSLEIE